MRRWLHELWEQRDLTAVDRWLAEDSCCYGLADDGDVLTGREAFRRFAETFLMSFSEVVVGIEDCIEVGDKACARCVVQVTQEGTGRRARFEGVFWARFQDGRLMAGWNYFDFATMLRQLEGTESAAGSV